MVDKILELIKLHDLDVEKFYSHNYYTVYFEFFEEQFTGEVSLDIELDDFRNEEDNQKFIDYLWEVFRVDVDEYIGIDADKLGNYGNC